MAQQSLNFFDPIMPDWDRIYRFLGIKEIMDFISSSELQYELLPIKIGFILFILLFLGAVIYFYIKSSYVHYHILQDAAEFLYWQPSGLREVVKRWQKIIKRIEGGGEKEHKLAIVEADDLLFKVLEEQGYEGETFEELVNSARNKIMPNTKVILSNHAVRDSIVYNPDYQLDILVAKKILADYEKAIKSV